MGVIQQNIYVDVFSFVELVFFVAGEALALAATPVRYLECVWAQDNIL